MEAYDKRRKPAGAPKLQTPDFNLVIDDGHTATYRAYVEEGPSVFALTVVTSSPADGVGRKQLQGFLGRMKVGFELVDAGPEQDPPVNSHIPFDPGTDVLIIAELVIHPQGGPSGVRFAIKDIAPGPGPPHTVASGGNLSMGNASGPIGHKNQLFVAAGHQKLGSTVSCGQGSLTVVHPKVADPIVAGQPGVDLPAVVFIRMHGNQNDNEYLIEGNFSLVKKKKK